MRKINTEVIARVVKEKCIEINHNIDSKLLKTLKNAYEVESSELGKDIISTIIENSKISQSTHKPMCQDTGSVIVFLDVGNEVIFDGDVYAAINQGVKEAYSSAYLRKSIVKHPLKRANTKDNCPAIVHTNIVEGDQVKLKIATKGGGAENMSRIKMLTPSAGYQGVVDFVLETVLKAKGNACPPIIVGIGIGGNFEKCALLAKQAVIRDLEDHSNIDIDRQLEEDLFTQINNLGIGPMGLGGNVTALAVKVNSYPCHIASLPVAVNIQCHSAREIEVII